MRYCKYLIIFFIAFLPAKIFAQPALSEEMDITGLWKGTLYNDSTKKFYRYEIGISEEKGKLSGFSHTFFLVEDKEFYGVKKIKIKKKDGKIIVEDAGLLANNYPEAPAKGVKQLNVLTLEIKDSIMILSGPFTTNRTKDYSPLTGTINLQRKNDFWQSALVPHLQELGLQNDLSFVKKENERIIEEEIKKEAEAIAAQSKKQKIEQELAKNEEAKKAALKNTNDSKNIAAATEHKIKTAEPKQEVKTTVTQKEIASNTTPVKPEAKKETKTNEPKPEITSKEIVSNTTPVKNETDKEIKAAEPKLEAKTIVTSKEIAAKREAQKSNAPAAEVNARTNVIQQTVYFASDSLQISLYDNGEVDGDTVSVLMNGQIIMAKERLSTNAVRKTIYPPANTDSIELLMYAENLGTIAPNTGLLVVHDGKSIYEIRFSGDLKKNASIILRRRKN